MLYFVYLIIAQVSYLFADLQIVKRYYGGLFSLYAIGFLGYALVPARGPYLAMTDQFTVALAGGWLTHANDLLVANGSNHVDVFPSLHVGNALYLLMSDYRYKRWRFWTYLVPCVGLWLSTLYLRYHYFVDVACGVMLGWLAWQIANRFPGKREAWTFSEPNSVALITGGSDGIGLELARLFAQHKHDLIIVARDAARLEAVASDIVATSGVRVETIARDLSVSGVAQALCDELDARGEHVDYLVNCAGVGTYGWFLETDLDRELRMMQLNMLAVTILTKRLLPAMVNRHRGAVMNVASTAAFQPGPLMAVYYATKAYVLSFSEALAEELRGSGVTVTALCPGPTRSSFQRTAGMEASKLFRFGVMDAQDAAAVGYAAFMRGQATVIPGWLNKLSAFGVRLTPRFILPKIVMRLQEPAGSSRTARGS
jgi:uncharacterized protein